jgi:cytoskeletal protein CcmA (bactofilin family)
MFNNKKPAVAEEFNGFLAQGTSFTGDLQFSGTLHLNGNVRGSITTGDLLIIGEHATVEADIKAGEIQISGTVIGSVTCVKRIEISECGRLRGDVRTAQLIIKEGGIFEGTSLGAAAADPSHRLPENTWSDRENVAELTTS